jgi:ubiquinone/menaquinone biosynthesis C-methylase UbiE
MAISRYRVFREKTAAKRLAVETRRQLSQSEKEIESVGQWWDKCHSENERYRFWLTGSDASQVWSNLKVEDRIETGKSVLNIGVGQGHCTRALSERGCRVQALDISPVALARVSDCVAATWLPSQLKELPTGVFDLAISHLVAQHMSDSDLSQQIREVVRSLNADGVFALQFAFALNGNDNETEEKPANIKDGSMRRSLETVRTMATDAGGRLVWAEKIAAFPEYDSGWYAVHIQKQPG